jgi:hypothetical protein
MRLNGNEILKNPILFFLNRTGLAQKLILLIIVQHIYLIEDGSGAVD